MDIHEHKADEYSNNHSHHDLFKDIVLSPRRGLLGCLIGSFNGLYDCVDGCRHTTGQIAGSKPRHELVPNDLGRTNVRQDPLQAIPDFNANLPFLDYDYEQDAIVGALVTELPAGRYTMRELFEGIPVEGWNGQYANLIARLGFMSRQLSGQRLNRGVRQDMGQINDSPSQRRDITRMCKNSERQDRGQG